MIGHVTSSYYSPILRRSIALALVRAAWTGWANASKCRWPMVGGAIAVISSPVFYDARERQHAE